MTARVVVREGMLYPYLSRPPQPEAVSKPMPTQLAGQAVTSFAEAAVSAVAAVTPAVPQQVWDQAATRVRHKVGLVVELEVP